VKDPDELLKAAAQLADGESPDWTMLLDQSTQPPPAELKNLRSLERLAQAFARGREETTKKVEPPAFLWKHLEVFESIGQGGFGEVFRAYDPTLQRSVALKLRRETTAGEDPLSNRVFIQEARRLARIRHPNVLAVHGADSDNGRVGLWTDLVPGQSLQAAIEDIGHLSADQVLKIGSALADALNTIHRSGLIHGDIKASNVMLQPDGSPLLMDFGAAIERDAFKLPPTAGSPLMMAPELLEGTAPSAASDLYSLGVLLFQSLTSRYPMQATSLDELAELHRRSIAVDWQGVPHSFRPVLRHLLSADPKQRPGAEKTALMLDEIRTRPLRRRRRIAVAAIIASLVIGLGAAGFGLFQARQSARQALTARDEAADVSRFLTNLLSAPREFGRGAEARVSDLLDDAARDLQDAPPSNPVRAARFRSALGRTYTLVEQYEKSRELLQRALADQRTASASARDVVATLIALGINTDHAGQKKQAVQIFADAASLSRVHLGKQDPLTLESQYRHGELLAELGQVDEALVELRQTLAASQDLPEQNDLPSLIKGTLAIILRDQGKLEEAEQLAREALDWQLAHHSETYPNVLQTRALFSTILIERGRFAEAEGLLRQNLNMLRERFSEGSYKTRNTMVNLATALDRLGRDEESLALNAAALEMARKSFGPLHIQTLVAAGNHANRLAELGRTGEAEAVYREVITNSTEAFDPTHKLVLINRGNLAELLLNVGRLAEAETLARFCLDADLKALGESHMITLFAMDILGVALTRQNKLDEGQALLQEVYELKLKIIGEDNPYTWDSAAYLAEAKLKSGDSITARVLLREVVARRSKILGPDDPKTLEAAELLERAISNEAG